MTHFYFIIGIEFKFEQYLIAQHNTKSRNVEMAK